MTTNMDFDLRGPVTIRTEDGETERFDGSVTVTTSAAPDISKPATGSSSSSDIICSSSSTGSEKTIEEMAIENIDDMNVDQLRELMREHRR